MQFYEQTMDLNICNIDNIAIMAKLNYHLALEATKIEGSPFISLGNLDNYEHYINKKS